MKKSRSTVSRLHTMLAGTGADLAYARAVVDDRDRRIEKARALLVDLRTQVAASSCADVIDHIDRLLAGARR